MARTKRNPSDPVEIKFSVDGATYVANVVIPEVPTFTTVPEWLAHVAGDESALVAMLRKGFKALFVSSAKKVAKAQWIKTNQPNRAAIRKLASMLFAGWAAKVSNGAITTRKDARKEFGDDRVSAVWAKCIVKATAQLSTADLDVE